MAGQSASLVWAKRATGIAGLVAGGGMVVSLALNFSLTPAVVDTIGVEALTMMFNGAAWLTNIGSLAVLIGFGWGRWLSRPFWARGLVPLLLGLGVGWGWYLLNRYVDLWGVQAQLASGVEVPAVGWLPTVVIFAVSTAAAVLVVFGAVRVLGSPLPTASAEPGDTGRSGQAEAASEGSGDRSDDDDHDVGRAQLERDRAGDQ